ncbi:MAG TPA: hypothetical protein VES67_19735 [Vicinamibacterales bacterium]|nr:hypothetical protein [Vicinamibacterales bacterium]
MQKQTALGSIVVATLLAAASAAGAQSPDPWIGTWKVNLAKSTFSPGPTPTATATVKIEATAGGIKTTIDLTDAEGKPVHTESDAKFDGKDVPVKGAPLPNTTTAIKRIDARTYEATGKVEGKPTITTRITISADGKTMTATQTGTNAEGQKVNNVIVADKQ